MISGWWQTDEIEVIWANLKLLFSHFMYHDAIPWLLKSIGTEHTDKLVEEVLDTRRPINMQIRGALVSSRPCSGMKQGNQVGNMVGMKVGQDDVLEVFVLYPNLQEPLQDAMPTVKEDRGSIQFDEDAGGSSFMLDLAGTGAKEGQGAHVNENFPFF